MCDGCENGGFSDDTFVQELADKRAR